VKTVRKLSLSILSAVSYLSGQTTPSGLMLGSVTGDDGLPLAGATVLYQRIYRTVLVGRQERPAPGEAVVRRATSSDASGAFLAPNLPAGDYFLCAEVPSAPYLNPCKWSSAPKATIAAGAVNRPALVLNKGVLLKVRVNDPAGLLPPVKERPFRGVSPIVGVIFGNGAFLAAANTGVGPFAREYQMSIPAGLPLKLWVYSRHVTFRDSAGSPVDNLGARIPFQAIPGRDASFVLTVSGRAPQSP